MILRVLQTEWREFSDNLLSRHDVETAGVILAERLHGGEVLLARHLVPVPAEGYQVRQIDQLRIHPVAINRLVRAARDRGFSVITVHTHPGTNQPWFSRADDAGDSRLMPSLFAQMAGPHGSVVIAGETGIPLGRMFSEPGAEAELEIRMVGQGVEVLSAAMSPEKEKPWFDRQRLALGEGGQAALRALHVGIVGLGGTGSVAFTQLAHLGVGRITVLDEDRVAGSNVSRIIAARCGDAGVTWKVDVAARYAEQLGLGTQVTPLRAHLGTAVTTARIEACDIILSCVDKHTPRALLNRLAYEKVVPVIDMGSAFRVDGSGRVVAGAGRVVVIGPGRPCLACWGHIDPNRLRIEALSAEDRASEVAAGYIDGADVQQPSVIAFNTMIAGAAVIELLRLVTRFAGAENPPAHLSFDFEAGTVRRNRLAENRPCTICARESSSHVHHSPAMSQASFVTVRPLP